MKIKAIIVGALMIQAPAMAETSFFDLWLLNDLNQATERRRDSRTRVQEQFRRNEQLHDRAPAARTLLPKRSTCTVVRRGNEYVLLCD